jgi:23S rRNA (pseudouridine1915-N3)-methyltransferase
LRWRIVCIGRDRKGLYAPLTTEYLARLQRTRRVDLVVAGESSGDDTRARAAEAAALRKRIHERDIVVGLDERGIELTSQQLAARLSKTEREGGRDLCFVLGGASGLDEGLKRDADWLLSLSRMTLPHLLARVVLLEQLYRCETILRGEPYSK